MWRRDSRRKIKAEKLWFAPLSRRFLYFPASDGNDGSDRKHKLLHERITSCLQGTAWIIATALHCTCRLVLQLPWLERQVRASPAALEKLWRCSRRQTLSLFSSCSQARPSLHMASPSMRHRVDLAGQSVEQRVQWYLYLALSPLFSTTFGLLAFGFWCATRGKHAAQRSVTLPDGVNGWQER